MKKTLIAITLFSASLAGVLEAAELNGSQQRLLNALYYSDAKRESGWTDQITIADPGLTNYTVSIRLKHNVIDQLIKTPQTSDLTRDPVDPAYLFSFSDGATTLTMSPKWSPVDFPPKYYLTGFGGLNLVSAHVEKPKDLYTEKKASALFSSNNPVDLQQLGITFTVSNTGTTMIYIGMMVGGATTHYAYAYEGTDKVTNLKELVLDSRYVQTAYVMEGVASAEAAAGLNWTKYDELYPEDDDNDQPGGDSPSVPEPTTTTLSLMALAALAARRRRRA